MKKLLTIILLITVVYLLSGCRNIAAHDVESDRSDIIGREIVLAQPLKVNEALTEIELTVLNDIRTNSEFIAVMMVNPTEHTITYGESFSLEFFYNDEWHLIQFPDDIAFIAIGYTLLPDGTTDFNRHIAWLFPNGLPYLGLYRFRTHIFNDADIPIRPHHLHDLVAEFYVQE